MNDPLKILIVEDESVSAIMLKFKLLKKGFIVTDTIPTGEEAIESVKRNPPDLILMDILLPGKINGLKTVKIINSFKKIPVIFITGYDNQEIIDEAMLLEPVAYLIKPLDYNELFKIIDKLHKT